MKSLLSTGVAVAILSALALGGVATAQQNQGHSGHGTPTTRTGDSAATTAFKAANTRMHKDMDIAFTGDVDADFVRGMIPHHQGAVDMAKTVLAFGKDPQIRKLAEEIVKAQETEIALMQEWLKKNAK